MIEIKDLTKIYKIKGKSDLAAVNNVSLKLPSKGMVFIVGKSGSGKSTFLNMLGGLDTATSGEILVDGVDITKLKQNDLTKYRSSHVSFIFQDYHILESFTVKQNVGLSLDLKNTDNEDLIMNTLQQVDLSIYADRYPDELSGGQKQRVAIARALVKGSKVVLCDEPTGNLDKKTTTQVLDLLKKISQTSLVLIVSHSIIDANNYADRIIELSDGKIVRDRERRKNYSNEFKIENNVINIPHYNDLTSNELILVNEEINNNDQVQFKQIGNRFYEAKDITEEIEPMVLTKNRMNRKTTKRLFTAFFKDKRKSIIFSVLVTSLLLVCFAIFQSFLEFDGNKELSETLGNHNINVLPLQKGYVVNDNVTLSGINRIEKDEITAFHNIEYEGDIFYKYNTTLPITSFSIDGEASTDFITMFKNFYLTESLGTINCDEKYPKEYFGEHYNLIKATDYGVEYKPYGVYITDYIADSIILYLNTVIKDKVHTYEDLFGIYLRNKIQYGYVNGIIETGYKVRYKELVDKIDYALANPKAEYNFYQEFNNKDIYMSFLTEAINFLGYGYSFDENYEEAIKSIEFRQILKVNKCDISLETGETSTITAALVLYNNDTLAPDEIHLNLTKFNTYFGTSYLKASDYNPEEPLEITFTYYNDSSSYNDIVFQKTFKVTKLIDGQVYSYINMEHQKDFQELDYIKYGLYFGDNTNSSDILEVANEHGFVICSTDATKLSTINRVLDIFGKFFLFIEIFFLLIAILFIVNVGISTIKKNRYDIGVLKAIGVRNFDIVRIFIRQTLILCLLICFVANVGIYFGTMAGNSVLVAAFERILKIEFYDLTLINYLPQVVITDLIYIGITCIISFIIPQLLLFRIKPIDIIRAKE